MQPLQDDDNQTLSLFMTGTSLNQQLINAVEEQYLHYTVPLIKNGTISNHEEFTAILKNSYAPLLRDHLKLEALNQILRDVQKAFPILDGTASDKLTRLIQNSKKLSIDLIEKRQELLNIAIQKAQEAAAKQK